MRSYSVWKLGTVAIVAGLAFLRGPAEAGEAAIGQEEFRTHCAACHGMSGLGDGPIGQSLKTPAPNLALIAQRNGGVFPFQRVYEVIEGNSAITAHGTRDMPLWGDRYRKDLKPVTPDQLDITNQLVEKRILSLVYYIGTLQ
jgi:mono/diheme cytochrome c family protein